MADSQYALRMHIPWLKTHPSQPLYLHIVIWHSLANGFICTYSLCSLYTRMHTHTHTHLHTHTHIHEHTHKHTSTHTHTHTHT